MITQMLRSIFLSPLNFILSTGTQFAEGEGGAGGGSSNNPAAGLPNDPEGGSSTESPPGGVAPEDPQRAFQRRVEKAAENKFKTYVSDYQTKMSDLEKFKIESEKKNLDEKDLAEYNLLQAKKENKEQSDKHAQEMKAYNEMITELNAVAIDKFISDNTKDVAATGAMETIQKEFRDKCKVLIGDDGKRKAVLIDGSDPAKFFAKAKKEKSFLFRTQPSIEGNGVLPIGSKPGGKKATTHSAKMQERMNYSQQRALQEKEKLESSQK